MWNYQLKLNLLIILAFHIFEYNICHKMSYSTENKGELVSRVIKTEHVEWKKLQFLQSETFKDLTPELRERLKKSILADNFAQPFYVWQNPEDSIIYCLDGKHRTQVLNELIADGYNIPELLPATFIQCESKNEAAKLVLVYSSIYAKTTHKGLFDFIETYELLLPELRDSINLPEFDLSLFEQMNFNPDLSELVSDPKAKLPSMKITFKDEKQLEKAKAEIDEVLKKYEGSFMSVSCGEI